VDYDGLISKKFTGSDILGLLYVQACFTNYFNIRFSGDYPEALVNEVADVAQSTVRYNSATMPLINNEP
jgi:hypothetical protein